MMPTAKQYTGSMISIITISLSEVQLIIKNKPPEDKVSIKEFKTLEKRLQSALDIVDGTRYAKCSAGMKSSWASGKGKHKASGLANNHDKIVEAMSNNVGKTALAKELGVNRVTLYKYMIANNIVYKKN